MAFDINNLDFNNAGSWPPVAKAVAILLVITAVGAAGYWFIIKEQRENLIVVEAQEQQLRAEFKRKQEKLANVEAYRQQLQELRVMLAELLKQLPTGTEMPNLLDDISETGRRNGLVFELFKPEAETPKDFYAAKPISIRAKATYHQFGDFISDLAALDRIVTLEEAAIQANTIRRQGSRFASEISDEVQNIEAKLQVYRYIEESEVARDANTPG